MEQFADRTDAVEFIAERLSAAGNSSSANDIASAIADVFKQAAIASDDASSTHRATFKPARWVIRNQDLGVVDSLGGILQGSATGAALGYSTGSASLGMLAPALAVITHITKIAFNIHGKGVKLAEEEFFVLVLLKESPDGRSSSDLATVCTDRFGARSPEQIESLLERLAKFPSRSGDLALAWKSADGLWRSKDV